MLSLSVSRTTLGLVPLTAADTTQTTGATIREWEPGLANRDVDFARSKWASGGVATRTRDDIVAMNLTLFLRGGSLAASRALAETWALALGQLEYTLTETVTSATPRTFTAMPASVDIPVDTNFWRAGIVLLSATIPRNPWP